MILLYYDGSFDGLLTAVFDAFCEKTDELEILPPDSNASALFTTRVVCSDSLKSSRVAVGVEKQFPELLKRLYYAWLSHYSGVETDILMLIKRSYALGRNCIGELNYEFSTRLHKAAKRVGFEAHRFLGLTRFRKQGDIYISEIYPDNEVLPLMSEHFCDRFSMQQFIIADMNHMKALVWNGREAVYADATGAELTSIFSSLGTDELEDVWASYLKVLTIKERKNLKLQQSFIPIKYRSGIVELREDRHVTGGDSTATVSQTNGLVQASGVEHNQKIL